MKIQIIKNDGESIDGFITLKLGNDTKLELSKIINNSCTEILLLDIIDLFEYNKSIELISDIVSKIRLNGSLILRGISSIAFSHSLLNGIIDSNRASEIISKIQSIHDHRDITSLLESHHFTIDTISLNGLSYELKATRNNT